MSFNPGDLVSLREKEKINPSGSARSFMELFPDGVAVVRCTSESAPHITYLEGPILGIFSYRIELCATPDLGDML